jgi:hypothetical protein
MFLFEKAVSLLPAVLQPYAKALFPAVATVTAVGAHWAATGELNETELKAAAQGAALSLLAFLFPNISK